MVDAASGIAPAIDVRDVHKTYRRYGRQRRFGTLKSALLSGRVVGALTPDERFEALRGVSFSVPAGTTLGVIGRNGSGKSTALKLIAGIGKPTSGSIHVAGRASALIELGAGFHPEISGRDNVYINGMMLGLSKREIAQRFDEIVAFAELADFIDAPVKTYSSGMYVRLGFAIAVNVDPDVLLVDEVLAVGDEAFTHKCLDKFADFRRRGKTVLLVTHSLDLVNRLCDAALWLDAGVVRAEGDPKRVIDAYLMDVARAENEALSSRDSAIAIRHGHKHSAKPGANSGANPAPNSAPSPESRTPNPAPNPESRIPNPDEDFTKADEGRWGSREVEIVDVELLGPAGGRTHVFESGDRVDVRLRVRAHTPVSDFVFGIGIFNAEGVSCYGTNTFIEGARPEELAGDGEVTFAIDRLDLVAGTYKLDVAVHRENGAPYDYHRLLHTFRVTSPYKEAGIFRPPHRWTFGGGIRMSGLE